jgi:hypothetical protein
MFQHLGGHRMSSLSVDRKLFVRLVDRWNVLEIEHTGFRAMLEEVKRVNPGNAKDLEAVYQMTTDHLRNDPIEIEGERRLGDALFEEDDDAFLHELDLLLTHRQTPR